jgi:glycosyltransferase involved in cell wall biosynthesis
VIKSINGLHQPKQAQQLRDIVHRDDRIVFIDEYFNRDRLLGLQSVVDCYVSLHRAEGFGFGMIEAMYQRKPVIATGYSGNLEFMTRENSCLVDYTLVPVSKGEYVCDDERFRWADPDIDHAAFHMSRLVRDETLRTRMAERGHRDISQRFSPDRIGALMRKRLVDIGVLEG